MVAFWPDETTCSLRVAVSRNVSASVGGWLSTSIYGCVNGGTEGCGREEAIARRCLAKYVYEWVCVCV